MEKYEIEKQAKDAKDDIALGFVGMLTLMIIALLVILNSKDYIILKVVGGFILMMSFGFIFDIARGLKALLDLKRNEHN